MIKIVTNGWFLLKIMYNNFSKMEKNILETVSNKHEFVELIKIQNMHIALLEKEIECLKKNTDAS